MIDDHDEGSSNIFTIAMAVAGGIILVLVLGFVLLKFLRPI